MTKVLERLRLQAAASQKAAKDMQELANAEALELQQVRKAAEVSLSMHSSSVNLHAMEVTHRAVRWLIEGDTPGLRPSTARLNWRTHGRGAP